jgi:TP901 family phage tail tape measure protein
VARTVSVKLLADISQYSQNMRRATADTKSLSTEIDKAAKGGRLDEVTNMATGLGLGLVGAAAVAVKFSMDFEKQMSSVKAATHASTAEINQLKAASLQAGKDTAFSATEAAKGVEELAKAGVSTSDILGGGLKGALDLAAAGELGVGEAAETAASALTQFKLKGKDVPHVADLLSAAAGKAQGSVHDMGMALNQAGLVASQTGLSIEDTTGTLAAFANAGLIGSDAGTSFKQMLLMLQAPSDKTRDLMEDLGISAYDASGQFIGITALAGQLKTQMSKLTPELRANAMAQIFGADATRAASILYEQGQDGIQGWIDKTNDSGYAAETAAMKTDNLAGDLERLKGSLETAAIESGGGLNQGLRVLTKAADGLVSALDDLPSGTTAAVTAIAGISGVVLLGLVGWVKARTAISNVVMELNAVGPAGARAATGLQAAQKWAGRAAVAFVAMEAAGYVFEKLGNGAVKVDKLTEALENYANTGNIAGELTSGFGKNLEDFSLIAGSAEAATHGFWGGLNDLITAVPGVGSAVDSMNESLYGTSFNDATDRMQALDESLTAYIGTQTDATKANELWNRLVKESGLDITQLATVLPGAWAAMGELQKTTHASADGQRALGMETTKTTEEIKAEKEQAEMLKKAFDDLFSQYMSVDKAAIQYQDTLEKTNKELKDGKRTLDNNTEAGRENRRSTLDMIDAINDSRTANINNGMEVGKADKKYRQQIETLKQTMLHLGYTKKDVEALIGKYRDVPKRVGTSVETPGLPKAKAGAINYKKDLDKIDRKIQTKVSVTGDDAAYKKLERLLVAQQAAKKGISVSAAASAFRKNAGYATGGWTGPGGKFDPAGIVHADEYVIRKESRQRLESTQPGLLDELNATGQLPGHAAGGMVMPFPVNASVTKIMSMADALSKVATHFSKDWPSSPMAQRGDSGIWRKVVSMIKATGPMSGSFGNGYRPGDPKWHGSGRAVDWMGYNQDRLATYLAGQRPLELIHRGKNRDYAYTRGRDKGSFNEALMNAHRNHVHIAMAEGGVIGEPVFGIGRSGASYSFGEGGRPETVIPGRPEFAMAARSPIVNVSVASPGRGRGGPIVGQVIVHDRTSAQMLVNQLEFASGGF